MSTALKPLPTLPARPVYRVRGEEKPVPTLPRPLKPVLPTAPKKVAAKKKGGLTVKGAGAQSARVTHPFEVVLDQSGRPAFSTESATVRISVSVSKEERTTIKEAAELQGLSVNGLVSEYLRGGFDLDAWAESAQAGLAVIEDVHWLSRKHTSAREEAVAALRAEDRLEAMAAKRMERKYKEVLDSTLERMSSPEARDINMSVYLSPFTALSLKHFATQIPGNVTASHLIRWSLAPIFSDHVLPGYSGSGITMGLRNRRSVPVLERIIEIASLGGFTPLSITDRSRLCRRCGTKH